MAHSISRKHFALGAAVAAALLMPGVASAAVTACPDSIKATTASTPGLYANIGCQYSTSADQDFLNTNPITVNAEQFFGFTDWTFDGKWEINEKTPANSVDSSQKVDFTGNSQSGTWNIVSSSGVSDFLFIFKDGQNTTLVGYHVAPNPGCGSGCTYVSPFINPPFNVTGSRDVSHISVYFRAGSTNQVPEPGALALVALGLAALGFARRARS